MTSPLMLNYAARSPQASLPYQCWRAVCFGVVAVIFVAILILRAALLLCGFVLIFAGTLLLYLGGKRSAAITLRRWRARSSELLRLWASDIARPFRRSRPVPVLP